MTAAAPAAPRSGAPKIAVVLVLTGLACALILLHVPGMNGPYYWTWTWRRLAAFPLYPLMAAAAIPFVVGQWLHHRRRDRVPSHQSGTALPLALVALSTLALQLAALAAQSRPFGLDRLAQLVDHASVTSYYTDAAILYAQDEISVSDLLYQYTDILPLLHNHAGYKPPGLILFYYAVVAVAGQGYPSALLGGLLVALLASCVGPATYALVNRYAGDADAAFHAGSFVALCPSIVLMTPQFDQVYAPLSCLILVAWGAALLTGRTGFAVAFGTLLSLGLFLSHIFLGLGVFLAVFTLLFMGDRGRRGVDRAVVQAVIAALTALALYGLLWALTGFDPVATIRYIASRQAADLVKLARPYPLHLLFDPLDVALGTGYVSIPLVGFYLLGGGKPRITKMFRLFAQTPAERLTFLGLLQLLVLWAAAMLPGEGARLWLPFLPLLMAPIGFELTTWSFRARLAVYACLWLVTTVVCQNMIFLYLGPEIDGPR